MRPSYRLSVCIVRAPVAKRLPRVASFHHVSFAHRLTCRKFLQVKDDGIQTLSRNVRGVETMKKLALLGIVLLLSTGCRSGFLSKCRQGAPCRSGCGAPPAAAPDCNSCCPPSYRSGYGGYEGPMAGEYYGGDVIGGDYYDGQIVPGSTQMLEGVPVEGTTISPPMSTIPQPAS